VKRYVITLRETPERREACRRHLEHVGFSDYTFWNGVNALKWGLMTRNTYDVDHPNSGFIIPMKHVGLHLSHWILWNIALEGGDDCVSIMEDDVSLSGDWMARLVAIRNQVPDDWDIIMLGSCNTAGKPTTHVNGSLFEVKYPQCTHWYLVRRKALPILISTQEKSWAPIDLALIFNSFPQLRVYTAIPRLASQHNMDLAE
jgi:GR25 family glycosyltransferase involved in LPS biosynthesis